MGKMIRQLRKERKWTQEDLAERMGVTRVLISLWERDLRKPPVDKLKQLAGVFGVPTALLLGEEVPPRSMETVLAELEAIQPVTIPIVEHIGSEGEVLRDYVYWTRSKVGNRNIKGLIAKEDIPVEPKIEEGDIVFTNLNQWPENGNLVLALVGDKMLIKRYKRNRHQAWLEDDSNQEEPIDAEACTIYGVVIQVNKLT